jgi:hypothetical protein
MLNLKIQNSEITIKMTKPTPSSVLTGTVYGLDDK